MNKRSDTTFLMKNITNTQIEVWFKANGIIHEKTELFHDFVFSLYNSILQTYMGDDVTESTQDKCNHFNWCWNKVLDTFEKEKIFFERTGQHYEYFLSFFLDSFYEEETKEDPSKIESFFTTIFNITAKKTKSELDMFGDLYKLLERYLKKVT